MGAMYSQETENIEKEPLENLESPFAQTRTLQNGKLEEMEMSNIVLPPSSSAPNSMNSWNESILPPLISQGVMWKQPISNTTDITPSRWKERYFSLKRGGIFYYSIGETQVLHFFPFVNKG